MQLFTTRRSFLLGGTALALSPLILGGSDAFAQAEPTFDTPVAIPAVDEGTIEDGVRVFDLSLQAGQTEFFKGLQTETIGINQSYLGPLLRMTAGETVRINVTNNMDDVTALHWHGFNIPAVADGGPHQPIQPGETWSPEFRINEAASLMWFHSHLMHASAAQVWAGLAGLILIDDDHSIGLNLPSDYGVDDIPLVLQDRRFSRNGGMDYDMSMHDEMAGMAGNIPLINGTVSPHFSVITEKLRLRLLNGANGSIYNLAFADRRTFVQIGSDGGLLSAPVALSQLRLAPGERADIVVDFAAGETVLLQSITAYSSGGMSMMTTAQNPQFDLMEFRADQNLAEVAGIPDQLANLPVVSANDAVRTRRFLLEMPDMGPLRMLGVGGDFTINGKSMDLRRIDEVVNMGETEIWEITNAGPMIHPFHIHNTQFRILDRNGQAPAANEAGLKDVVVVSSGETVRVLLRFDNYTDLDRPYMYHCHILEHEDAGMMGQFTVV